MVWSILDPMADAASATGIDVGTVIADTYRVTGLLGCGGMGAVWAADHARLPGKQVAIKVLHAEVAGDRDSLARFRREAEIASRLGHPNIIDVHDFNVLPDGSPYLVLEFLDGEPLDARIKAGPMPMEQVGPIVRQVGSALVAAHREQIVHRDLKPANIFLVPTQTHGFVTEITKVLDFGISKIRGSQTVKTQDSAILGTPQYMAPEQALGHHDEVDARTDVFAFGAIVYEMLSGEPAFPGVTIPEVVFKVVYEEPIPLSQLVPELEPGVADIVHKAMSKKREDRFQSAANFVEALTGTPLDTLQPQVQNAHVGAASTLSSTPAGPSGGTGSSSSSLADSLRAARPSKGHDVISTGGQATQSALAQTVGSGDHADAVAVAVPSTPSIAEQSPPAERLEPGEQPSSRSRALWIGVGALALVGAAVGITIFAVGGSNNNTTAPRIAATAQDAAPAPVRPRATTPRDAAVTAVLAPVDAGPSAAPTDARKKPLVKPRRPVPRKPPTAPKPGKIDPRAEKLLAEARRALSAGQLENALHAVRRAGYIQQTARGFAIMTQVYCKRQDYTNARARLHKVRGALRRRVIRYCKRLGVDL